LSPLRELRSSLADLRLHDLAVGDDGRNRVMLSPFRSTTGRNQPSNSNFVFGPSVWLRGLIKPPPGHGLAYIDWKQQEFGIAAALSKDEAMRAAYLTGDPYLAFAKQARAVPEDATCETHEQQREQFKQCALAVQYGMGASSLAQRITQPEVVARDLLRAHREAYPGFWRWSDRVVNNGMQYNELWTRYGWFIPRRGHCEPAVLTEFPHAGERRRDASSRLLLWHRTWHRNLRPGS
jgi:hypothetical protein